ncbi:hypothetical protein ACFXHD_09825 [Streptomyces hydrogenans]|uniref:hypothetical protein n=1 Tax=Streptomyces hydrogenans TaxID=1873719 RepID=UPI0036B60AF0
MTFEYRDAYGRVLTADHGLDDDDNPMAVLWSRGEFGASVPVRIPASRVEEVVTGIRGAVRTAARQATGQDDTKPAYYGVNGCTCRAWTRVGGTPRFLRGDESVELIGGWEELPDCPHHAPAVGQPAEAHGTDEVLTPRGLLLDVLAHTSSAYLDEHFAPDEELGNIADYLIKIIREENPNEEQDAEPLAPADAVEDAR